MHVSWEQLSRASCRVPVRGVSPFDLTLATTSRWWITWWFIVCPVQRQPIFTPDVHRDLSLCGYKVVIDQFFPPYCRMVPDSFYPPRLEISWTGYKTRGKRQRHCVSTDTDRARAFRHLNFRHFFRYISTAANRSCSFQHHAHLKFLTAQFTSNKKR